MVIENDPGIAELLHEVLSGEGYDAVVVECLDQATADAAPDLVITDLIGLHHYDSELARALVGRVYERYPAVPIIVCTGHEPALGEPDRLGAAAVVRKPFTLEALIEVVAKAIAR